MFDECGDKVKIRQKHERTCLISNKSKTTPKPGLSNRETTEPDRNLTTWEKHLKERKQLTTKLTKATKREPVDTTLHSGINLREIKERRVIIEHAQVEVKAEIRDHQLWEQPQRLHQICSHQTVYELQRTTVEMGKVPEMVYMAIPEYIQKEEHGIERKAKAHAYGGFEKSVYKTNREKELEDKIRLIEPHRPILNSLIIKGNRPVKIVKKRPVPEVIIMKPYIPCITDMTEVYALRINNTVLIKDHKLHDLAHLRSMQKEKWHRNITLWTYYFNAPVGKMSRNKFVLTNLGTVTLRYCWQSIQQETRSLPKSVRGPVYFFNKNEDVLSPGQTREITFLFVSSTTGIYKEQWNFNVCNVNFLQPGIEFIIRLNADAVELNLNDIKREVNNLKKFIASEERNFTVHFTENYLVNKSVEMPLESYAYEKMFLDEDIFVMKNTDCHYHQTEVENLKQLYGIVIEQKNASWDLSIETLEKNIMKQQYDDRMRSYEKLKNAYQILITPFEERVVLPERKLLAMRQQLDQFIDKFESEKYRLKVSYCRCRTVARRLSADSSLSFNERVYQQLFYMAMREHFCDAIESGVALLNSLDLYVPLEFM